jgi:hypothetical protein
MLSHLLGVRLAVLIAAAASLSACRTFSPDGGMDTVAMVAGQGLNKDVTQVRSAEDAAVARTRVTWLLHHQTQQCRSRSSISICTPPITG